MTAPTIDEQIANLKAKMTNGDKPLEAAIATLQSIKDAGDDVVEPTLVRIFRREGYGPLDIITSYDAKKVVEYIDTLLAKYKLACVQRNEFRKDAERYRKGAHGNLTNSEGAQLGMAWVKFDGAGKLISALWCTDAEVDAAIDSARNK